MEINTKFAIGDKAFVLKGHKAAEIEIKAVFFGGNKVCYSAEEGPLVFSSYPEEHCFATKDELIEYILNNGNKDM